MSASRLLIRVGYGTEEPVEKDDLLLQRGNQRIGGRNLRRQVFPQKVNAGLGVVDPFVLAGKLVLDIQDRVGKRAGRAIHRIERVIGQLEETALGRIAEKIQHGIDVLGCVCEGCLIELQFAFLVEGNSKTV